jgi:hypothetical protein
MCERRSDLVGLPAKTISKVNDRPAASRGLPSYGSGGGEHPPRSICNRAGATGPASLRRSAAHLPAGADSGAVRRNPGGNWGVRPSREVDRGRHDLMPLRGHSHISMRGITTRAHIRLRRLPRRVAPPGRRKGEHAAARPPVKRAACPLPHPAPRRMSANRAITETVAWVAKVPVDAGRTALGCRAARHQVGVGR